MDKDKVEQGPTIVHRCLAGFVDRVCGHPKLVLTMALVAASLAIALAWTHLQYRTGRDDLMSADKQCQKRWRHYLAEFGEDEDMVVVVRGRDQQQIKDALEAIAGRLQQNPHLFDRLFYKVDLRPIHSRALLFLGSEEIQKIHDGLEPMRPLLTLGPRPGTFSPWNPCCSPPISRPVCSAWANPSTRAISNSLPSC